MSDLMVDAQCRCCEHWFRRRESDPNRIHFHCWAEHHSGPEVVWPPDHQCPVMRAES